LLAVRARPTAGETEPTAEQPAETLLTAHSEKQLEKAPA
jgi:hypothetical protein